MKAVQVGKTHKADQRHGKAQLDTRCEKKEQHHQTYNAYSDLTHIDPSRFSRYRI